MKVDLVLPTDSLDEVIKMMRALGQKKYEVPDPTKEEWFRVADLHGNVVASFKSDGTKWVSTPPPEGMFWHGNNSVFARG